jgi:glycosyltransferase involved in cell wall biosynthesis
MTRVSVIIGVDDEMAYLLPFTLDSIDAQDFPDFEMVLVDGTRRGLALHLYPSEKVRVIRAVDLGLFAMFNRGASHAGGDLLLFLRPGEYVISRHAFAYVDKVSRDYAEPDLIYGGCLVRHRFTGPTTFLESLSAETLQRGRLPATLQPYWFRKESFHLLGGFKERYRVQGGLELICRICSTDALRKVRMNRIFTDSEYRKIPYGRVVTEFFETFSVLLLYFGLTYPMMGWFGSNIARLFNWTKRMLRASFLGRAARAAV